ncbi:MAG: hypothetical protein JWR52_549 [Marmoricola sp.]|nr:hypothetical protein [Marmoricola sp.]
MPTHLGFLRAVNIGKRQFKTADLKAVLAGAAYGDVATYIQTGNIRITSPVRSRAKIETELEALFLADRGFEVPTIVFSPAELRQVATDADELARGIGFEYGQYVSLLKAEPSAEATALIEARSGDGETFIVRGRGLHLLYDIPFNEAKTTTAQIERAIGVATNRNVKVIRELVELWC